MNWETPGLHEDVISAFIPLYEHVPSMTFHNVSLDFPLTHAALICITRLYHSSSPPLRHQKLKITFEVTKMIDHYFQYIHSKTFNITGQLKRTASLVILQLILKM